MKSHLVSFFSFLKTKKVPLKEDLTAIKDEPFSLLKLILILGSVLVISLFLALVMKASSLLKTEVPDYGGSITEGVVGSPKYINPLLAITETDRLLSGLIYAPLGTFSDEGAFIPVLATECTQNPIGTAYHCALAKHLVFSDNTPLTSADVAFTFQTKKALALLDNPQDDWSTISIEAPDEQTVVISTTGTPESLKEIITLGVLPKSLWESIPLVSIKESTLNMNPIGAGPFALRDISYTNTIATDVFLKRNPQYVGAKPYLAHIKVHSFSNQLDLKAGIKSDEVDSTSNLRNTYIDETITKRFSIQQIPTKRTVSLFVHQQSQTSETAQALEYVSQFIDRNQIIDIIEHGYGIPLSLESTPRSKPSILTNTSKNISISIAVQKDDDLIATAELLSTALSEFGILSTVNVFDQGLFTDHLQLRSYSFVLTSTTDSIPGYQPLIPLYTKTIVHITHPDLHVKIPDILGSPHESLRDAHRWYIRTDAVWKWFIKK